MESSNLPSLIQECTAAAREASNGRAAHTICGGHGHELRQMLLVLLAGQELAEHDSPGEATLQVLQGNVRLVAGDQSWDGAAGDYVHIPPVRHSLAAVDDAAVLLTVVKPQ